IEACASSHHWSRELQALGHTVRLMPPAYVKPYVKRQKNDTADAEAICERGQICGSLRPRRPSIANPTDKRVPVIARACLAALAAQLCRLKEQILEFDRMIIAWRRSHEASKRLDAIPGVGPMLATALIASIADPKAFLAFTRAWLAAVPVRVISSPDRPNTRPPQRYRTTGPGA
ncbi:MAG: hypothetical protein WBX77_21305, partial [Pseudolabrys sp.]